MTSKEFIASYFQRFQNALAKIEITDENGQELDYHLALTHSREWLCDLQQRGKKIILVGNGGSAGVASHLSVDFWKNGKIRALTFNEGATLTCISNDLSYQEVFAAPISQFADQDDLIICISSSGSSENILRAASAARDQSCRIITCSGFDDTNRLRSLGHLNFYVPSYSYGFVETIHQLIIHSLLDGKMYCDDQVDIFHRNNPTIQANTQ